MTTIKSMMDHFAQPGSVEWIGIRPQRKGELNTVDSVQAVAGVGLEGDHYASPNGRRQVTLIQYEHLVAIASYQRMAEVYPGLLRRNIVTRGINLLALKDKTFSVGHAVLRFSGECHPCSRMEENLGFGGYNAVRGHGGITAEVLEGGKIAVANQIVVLTV